MKPILRDKYRYIVVRLISSNPLKKEDLERLVRKDLVFIIGKLNYSKVMPKVVFFDNFKQAAIIRCLNEGAEILRTSFSIITLYESEKVHIMPIYTSGTIKKAKEEINRK